MRHYTTMQAAQGWAVVYRNHRGEYISIMECATLDAAYSEAAALTLDATKRALCGAEPAPAAHQGNRYLRCYL